MLEVMPASEYNRWKAFERMNGPLGTMRDDILHGLLMSLIANVNRDPKKKPYPLEDFVPRWNIAEREVRADKVEDAEGRDHGRRISQARY